MNYSKSKELIKNQILETKGIAILFMLLLHLFCTKNYAGLFEPLIFIGKYPLIYYLALFGDCCVAIYCFCSGYGLMYNYTRDRESFNKRNRKRILNLYIKYWIIFLIFVILIGTFILKKPGYPGSCKNIFLTLTGILPGYNGAWWFFTTYILLIITSKTINEIILRKNNILILICSLIFYFVAYIQRIKVPIILDSELGNYILRQLSLYGTSQLPFIVGAIFQKNRIYSYLSYRMERYKYKNTILYLIILAMIIFHGFIETLFIAVFTGIIFICCFNLIDKKEGISKFFQYMGRHSTNLWLIHMFIYMTFFEKYIYALKYPVLIYLWLVLICLIISCMINKIEKYIIGEKNVKIINNNTSL